MNKLIIANYGSANKGKSSTIKEVFKLLSLRYPENVTIYYPLESGDVKAIVEVQGVLIGIESQGDPNSRLRQSLNDFKEANCQIIVASCRTFGDTANAIDEMHQYGYQVIWTSNDKNWDEDEIVDYLNIQFAKHIVNLVKDRIEGLF